MSDQDVVTLAISSSGKLTAKVNDTAETVLDKLRRFEIDVLHPKTGQCMASFYSSNAAGERATSFAALGLFVLVTDTMTGQQGQVMTR